METEETRKIRNQKRADNRASTKRNETEDEEQKRKEKKRDSNASSRAKKIQISQYIGRNAQRLLYGEQIVLDLDKSTDTIGSMIFECENCNALKWKGETSTTCCKLGKINIERFPEPPDYLKYLWKSDYDN